MSLPHLEDYKTWPLESKAEIVLKKTAALIFHGLGLDIGLSFQDIENFTFVDSIVQDEKLFEELADPDISEQNRLIGLNVFGKLEASMLVNFPAVKVPDSTINDFIPKDFHHSFHHYHIPDIQLAYVSSFRNDHLDTPLLRFVVARQYDAAKAVEMAVKCLNWRVNVHPVDKYLMEGDATWFLNEEKEEFIDAFKLNQVYLRGYDLHGRPIVMVEVFKHFGHNCPNEDFERFICLTIEWTRLRLRESKGINSGCVLFDMTGFTLKNADLHAVKFLATAFEANYPEYLGVVLIHNAPWVFNAVWKVIKAWLDPVVTSKIHFTYKQSELTDYIDKKHIPERLGGEDTFEMEYIEPTKENSLPKPPDNNMVKIVEAMFQTTLKYVESTSSWIKATNSAESYNYLIQRLKYQKQVAELYVDLDPYIRTKGALERCGEMTEIGL